MKQSAGDRDSKTGRFYKGFIPWNKGLTDKDPRVKKNVDRAAKTFRKKYAKGEIKQPWNKGLTKEEDLRLLSVSKKLTGIKRRPGSIEKSRINAGKRIKKQYENGERIWWGYKSKNKQKWKEVQKAGFGNITNEARQRGFLALRKSPNGLEKQFNELLQSNFPNEYKYVGNGEVMIGSKFPDFININKQKKVILLNGTYWHTKRKGWENLSKEEIEKREKEPYEKFGFKVLHIWDYQLKRPKNVIKLVKEFTS